MKNLPRALSGPKSRSSPQKRWSGIATSNQCPDVFVVNSVRMTRDLLLLSLGRYFYIKFYHNLPPFLCFPKFGEAVCPTVTTQGCQHPALGAPRAKKMQGCTRYMATSQCDATGITCILLLLSAKNLIYRVKTMRKF